MKVAGLNLDLRRLRRTAAATAIKLSVNFDHGRQRRKRFVAAAFAAASFTAALNGRPGNSQSSALWRVVHNLCVVDRRTIGLPAPCTAVDLRKGIAIVKDAGGPTGYLLVPTRRLAGIEDPALLAGNAPNYWQFAWEARRFVERKASRRLDRTDLAIAVNSVAGRTQNQLHFHVDCVQSDVKHEVRSALPMLEGSWTKLTLHNHSYWVTTIKGADFGSKDPFRLVAGSDQAAVTGMGKQTLIVIGAQFDQTPGFYIISGSVSSTYDGHGEELLDHRAGCRRVNS